MWATTGNAIARITASGVITQFPLPDGHSGGSIVAGSDGNLWFTEDSAIGRITPSGTITEFPYPRTGTNVTCIPSTDIDQFEDIAGAPSQDVWFIDRASVSATGWRIGRITPSGEFCGTGRLYPGDRCWTGRQHLVLGARAHRSATGKTTTFPAAALGITAGPDGNMWFTEGPANKIGRITSTGAITEFPLPAPFNNPFAITTGPDGNLWFTEHQFSWPTWEPLTTSSLLGRVTPGGEFAGTGGPNSPAIAAGPDGNLWLTGSSGLAVLPPTLTPVNVTSPSVSGIRTEGETLQATPGTWMNSPSTFSYQWERCTAEFYECSPIPGATSTSYALSAADVGSRMRVGVSAATSDGSVSYEPAYSAYASVVQAMQPPAILSAPTITGAAGQGQILTEAHGTWTGNPTAFTNQWQRCVIGTTVCTDIPAATGQTYSLTAMDVGSAIRVQEWASNAAGTGGPANSARTTPVTPAPLMPLVLLTSPQMTGPPLISGTATVGLTLTATTGTWIGSAPVSFAYQWQRCNPGCANVLRATGATYRLTDQDVGAMVRVLVSASNSAGSAQAGSAQIGPVSPSIAAIKGQLGKVLSPSGKAARIGALLRTSGYRTSFRAISGGRLTIDGYHLPAGARLTKPILKPKPILIATGTVRFARAGAVTLTIRLTNAGRRMLRTAKTLKVTAKGTYIPIGGQATSATRNISLRR